MGSFSNYLENELLDHVFGVGAYTPPTVYVALSKADPTDAGTGIAEPSGNSYARVAHASWNAAANRSIDNNGAVTFPQATGAWGTLTHWALFDALNGGNMLAHGTLSASKSVVNGNTPSIASGEIDLSLNSGGWSTFLVNEMLDHVFGNGTYTAPSIYVALSTANPGDTGTGIAEPSGNNYARKLHTGWSTASNGATDNSSQITFNTPSGSWGSCAYVALFTALSSGNMLMYAVLGTAQTPGNGDSVYFVTGALDFTLD